MDSNMKNSVANKDGDDIMYISENPDGHSDPKTVDGTDTHQYPMGLSLFAILLSLFLGTFLMALDTTIITVAIPEITTDFNALDQVGWYGSAYLITLTAFQPISGSLYKSFDPKLMYLLFMVLFEIGSVLCAAAPISELFIFGRAIAGIGAAGLLQGALGILTFISPLEKRPIYMAVVISVFGITSSMGPVVGGIFTDQITWRWCFWVNLPIGFFAFLMVIFFLRISKSVQSPERELPLNTKLRAFDLIGMTLLFGFVSCLCIALQDGGVNFTWSSSRIVGLLVGFGILKILFWISQWRLGENALIPVGFLKQRTVAFGSLFLLLDNMSNYTKLYFLPFYFQAVLNTTAIRSGVNYIALAAPQFFALLLSGGLVSQFGHYMPVIMIGQFICVVGTGLLTRIDINTSIAEWAAFLSLAGIGLGMGINVPHIAIQAVMETETDIFLANGVATFFSQLGGTIAIPIGNAMLLNALEKYIPNYTDNINTDTAVRAGPLLIDQLSSSENETHGIRLAYSKAVQYTMFLSLGIVCASIPAAAGMEWLNLKKVSRTRESQRGSSQESADQNPSQ